MTLPATPPIDWVAICNEFGLNPTTAVWPTSFYGKGGAPSSGALSFSDFLGRSNAATYNPVPGSYSQGDPGGRGTTQYTITASRAVVWTWSASNTGTANVASGSSASSITFSLFGGSNGRTSVFTVTTDDGSSWTLTLTASGTGGGVLGGGVSIKL